MNLISAFMELDKLNEPGSNEGLTEGLTRAELISNLKALGKNYKFDKYSDAQLYRMWERAEADKAVKEEQDYLNELRSADTKKPKCGTCEAELTDGGFCPNCDDGQSDLINEEIGVFDIGFFDIGNYITDHFIFPSSHDKYKCILDIKKSRYKSFDDTVSPDEIERLVASYGGKLITNESLTEDFGDKEEYCCSACGHHGVYYKSEVEDQCCPQCHDHTGAFGKCEESLVEAKRYSKLKDYEDGLSPATEISTSSARISVVDQIKQLYEEGLFIKLPVGRDKAFMLDISGPDKERLTAYFKKQPEFNYEFNNEYGIVSHEFISDQYDIEIYDTFISMYKIPQNESFKEGIFDSKADKQKVYERDIENIFGMPSIKVIGEVISNVDSVITQVADNTGDDENASKIFAKNIITLIKNAITSAKGKTPLALIQVVISIGTKYEPNANGLVELRDFSHKANKLGTASKTDGKAKTYLMTNVNKQLEQKLNQTIVFLKKEFGIVESLGEDIHRIYVNGELKDEIESSNPIHEVDPIAFKYKKMSGTNEVKIVYADGTAHTMTVNNNISEMINKENNEMNFQTILEELDKLYEANQLEEAGVGFRLDGKTLSDIEDLADAVYKDDEEYIKKYVTKINKDINVEDLSIAAENSDYPREIKNLIAHMKHKGYNTIGDFAKSLEGVKESLHEEDTEESVVEEPTEEALKQVILECSKCGALAIKDEADVKVDEESDLANIDEACQYCEEAEGYKIIGVVAPYEIAEEELEEGIFGKKKNKSSKTTGNAANNAAGKESSVTISVYDENGTEQFSQVFKEIRGKMQAEEQFNEVIKSNGLLNRYKSSAKKNDWSYERKSNPPSPFDTDKYFNAASKIIRESIEETSEELDEFLDIDLPVTANVNVKADGNNVPFLNASLEDDRNIDEQEELNEGIIDESKKNPDTNMKWQEVAVTDIKDGDIVEINGKPATVEKTEFDEGTAQDTVLLTVKQDNQDKAKRYKSTDTIKKGS
jgi:hypothetical protein